MKAIKIASIIMGFVIDVLLVITLSDEVRRKRKEAEVINETSDLETATIDETE